MKTQDADLYFPVLGLSADHDIWGFWDLNGLTVCGPKTLQDGMQDGMELIDANGSRWRVEKVTKLRSLEPWPMRMVTRLLYPPGYRIEQDVTPMAPLDLAAVQDRVCDAMQAHPLFWCEPSELETVLVERLAEVRSTRTIADIHHVLGLDTFRQY